MMRRFLAALLVLCAACSHSTVPTAPNALFDATTRSTLARSAVPVYLPAWIPPFAGPRKKLFATATLYPRGYIVTVDPIKGCSAAGTCTFIALTATTDAPGAGAVSIGLHNGATAQFQPAVCTRTCGPASLEWQIGRYWYAIQMTAGDQSTLVRIADSYVKL
jgi:hypothetical protein